MKKFIFLVLAAGSAITAFTQGKLPDCKFKGVVTYYSTSIISQGSKVVAESADTIKMYFMPGKLKIFNPKAAAYITIIKQDTLYAISKYNGEMMRLYKKHLGDTSAQDKSRTVEKDISKTKKIAGYTCKKAIITFELSSSSKTINTVYYTDQLPTFEGSNSEYKGLNGFPLEITIANNGLGVVGTLRAISVKVENLPDSTFNIPRITP